MAAIVVETWIWYGVVVFMLGLRYVARMLHFRDIRKLQIEDWFMLFIFAIYTILIVFLNIVSDVNTNLIDPADIPSLTPQDISDRVYGSKCVLVVESMMCATQWGTKACLLMLYYRLTANLRQALVVKLVAGYCALTYLIMISLYYGYWCRPFAGFWETPTPEIQCATQTHHLAVNLAFNLSSDLLIISIPLPLFIRAHLEPRKKLLLVFPFSLGFFTIACAIASKHLSFTEPFSAEWINWYTRESSTAMIVSNMPYSWTIFRKLFGFKSFLGRNGSTTSPATHVTGRHASIVSVPTATHAHGPDIRTWPSKFFHRRNKTMQQLDSFGDHEPANDEFKMVDWKNEPETDYKSDPLSSSSFDESTGRSLAGTSTKQEAITDVDRLYRLDDEDLGASISKPHTERDYEP